MHQRIHPKPVSKINKHISFGHPRGDFCYTKGAPINTPDPYPRAIITPKGERAALGGHPWVYEAEVERLESPAGEPAAQPPEDGSLVDVLTEKGRYIGTGFYNNHSKIRIRLISRNANDRFDEAFLGAAASATRWTARARRHGRGGGLPTAVAAGCIFGEVAVTGSPGLTADRFFRGSRGSCQTLALGHRAAARATSICPRLVREPPARPGRTCARSASGATSPIRRLGGAGRAGRAITPCPGWKNPRPMPSHVRIRRERYPALPASTLSAARTAGFFLDQKYNRQAVARLARGKRVLDCFTHTGAFALNAAKGGAAFVRAVDVSEMAVELARQNAALNGLDGRMEFVAANVFDLLPQLEESHDPADRFDFIILDPPAFTKSRKTVDSAFRGYKEINLRAMKLLPRGGYLATASCSHFMEESRFSSMLHSAAHDAGRELRQIEVRQQAPDHPILWNVPETDYLKFFLFQVV